MHGQQQFTKSEYPMKLPHIPSICNAASELLPEEATNQITITDHSQQVAWMEKVNDVITLLHRK